MPVSERAPSTKRRAVFKIQMGLRGSLLAAFVVIAGMAIVISAGGGFALNQLGEMMSGLSSQEIPRLAASMQLATASESLASEASPLLNSDSNAILQERTERMKETHAVTVAKLAELTSLNTNPSIIEGLTISVNNLGDMIKSLSTAATETLAATSQHDKIHNALRTAQRDFSMTSTPALRIAQDQVNTLLASFSMSQTEALDASHQLDVLGEVIGGTNRVISDLMAVLASTSPTDIEAIEKAYLNQKARIDSDLTQLPDTPTIKRVQAATKAIFALGEGKGSVFQARNKELDAKEYGQLTLDETRKLNIGLASSVKMLIDDVQSSTSKATTNARNVSTLATRAMVIAGIFTLIGSALFVWLYVGRNILRRIRGLQVAMQQLSNGDLTAEIEHGERRDEIATMATSLEIFRDSMTKARELSAVQDNERLAKVARANAIEARILDFEATVRATLEKLQQSANTMQMTAQDMSATAEHSSKLVTAVASAAEETSVNVQTVSAGTEQLNSSIAEISRQVDGSARIAAKAVTEANETDVTMQGLADNATQISVVIDLIQTIASQTNLLALNATIEAARAGDAGRGFAVVASEVKNLADQTAKATDQIRAQITSMQSVTSSAVGAIRSISSTIGEIHEVATAISAAVEEQGAATREIARNIQHAAGGTSQVSSNIIGVNDASFKAGTAAQDVLAASNALHQEAEGLRTDIDTFLSNIRAA